MEAWLSRSQRRIEVKGFDIMLLLCEDDGLELLLLLLLLLRLRVLVRVPLLRLRPPARPGV